MLSIHRYIKPQKLSGLHLLAAASIWFEIWGSWIRVKKIRLSRKIFEQFRFFSGNFTNNKIDFSGQIFEKFRFFQVILQKIQKFRFFSGNFTKKSLSWQIFRKILISFRQFHKKFRFFKANF